MNELLTLLQWAVKSGLVPVGTAFLLLVFCLLFFYLDKRRSADSKEAISALQQAHSDTLRAVQGQVAMQSEHIQKCEDRYEILRTDLGTLQHRVSENQDTIMREVLNELRVRRS